MLFGGLRLNELFNSERGRFTKTGLQGVEEFAGLDSGLEA
jgi:hypothetical protein